MKPEEAINILQERIDLIKQDYPDMKSLVKYREALEIAVDTIKKDIPQKPVGALHSVPCYRCSNCQSGVVLYYCDAKPPHCQWCGQKLDWREEDEK